MSKEFSLSKSSALWLRMFLIGVSLAAVSYTANIFLAEINSGNLWGLTYGAIALALFFGAGYYGIRRRTMSLSSKLKMGRSFHWLQFHLYGGTLFVIFTLMHTGFTTPSGLVNWALWLLSIWVGISGVVGVILQRWIPRTLSSGLQTEAIYERIPELIDNLRTRAEKLISASPESVQRFYSSQLEQQMSAPRRSLRFFADLTDGLNRITKNFEHLKRQLAAEDSQIAEELHELYQTKIELDAQWTLQFVLRTWMIAHLPPSITLFALVIIHLLVVYFY